MPIFIKASALLTAIFLTSFSASASLPSEVTVPFKLHDNRILIDVEVNGKGPYTFLFDTGGDRSNSITPEVAKELDLKLEQGGDASGAGSGTQPMWNTHVDSYSIGGLVAKNQSMIVLDMSPIKK